MTDKPMVSNQKDCIVCGLPAEAGRKTCTDSVCQHVLLHVTVRDGCLCGHCTVHAPRAESIRQASAKVSAKALANKRVYH